MGWSFGGHHTYWGITQTDRYRAASAGAGANDLISMYSQTDIPEFYHTYLGPKPWEDFELYEERSAYRNVAKVTTPLLIQVGEKEISGMSFRWFGVRKRVSRPSIRFLAETIRPVELRNQSKLICGDSLRETSRV